MSSRLKLKFGSWEKPQVNGTPPSGRFAHSTVVVEDVLYVFGGSSYGENENTLYHNDMYTLKCKKTPSKLIGCVVYEYVLIFLFAFAVQLEKYCHGRRWSREEMYPVQEREPFSCEPSIICPSLACSQTF